MTVITYRKGVMACDSCWSEEDGLISNVQNKLRRLPSGAIYGGAGSADDRALLRLLEDIESEDRLPEANTLNNREFAGLDCLLVLSSRSVWRVYGPERDDVGGGLYRVTTPFVAVGSGAPVAYGAFAKGASAKEAARIACAWNAYCRPPIHSLSLKG